MTNKYNYDLDVFLKEDALSYYLLGVFITDGCVQEIESKKVVSLTSKDKEWIEIIKNIICPELPLQFYNGAWNFRINSVKLANWLIKNNCVPSKSLTVKAPEIPDEYFSNFLRGCIDGDGTFGIYNILDKRSKKEKYHKQIICALCSGSKDFIFALNRKLLSLGYQNTYSEEISKRKNPLYRITFRGRHALKIINFIYENDVLSLQRKKSIAEQIKLYYANEYVGNINRNYNDLSGENNTNSKLKEKDVSNILTQWFNINVEERARHGFKKIFYNEIKNKYPALSYAMLRDITSGRSWKDLFSKITT